MNFLFPLFSNYNLNCKETIFSIFNPPKKCSAAKIQMKHFSHDILNMKNCMQTKILYCVYNANKFDNKRNEKKKEKLLLCGNLYSVIQLIFFFFFSLLWLKQWNRVCWKKDVWHLCEKKKN